MLFEQLFSWHINLVTHWWSPYSPLWTNQSEPWRKNHVWTVFWCWMTELVKDGHWKLFLGMDLANWLYIVSSFCCKVLLYCVLTEKWQLKWTSQPFGGRQVYYRFVTLKGVWRRLWAQILSGNMLGNVTGKTETADSVRSNQVKCLDNIKCFNVSSVSWKLVTYNSILWNQKLWCGTLFLHKTEKENSSGLEFQV